MFLSKFSFTVDRAMLPRFFPSQFVSSWEAQNRFSAFEQTEWIWEAEEVILATDNDEAGKALGLELIHRFGRDICKVVQFPTYKDMTTDEEKQIKDANECLIF